MIRTALLISFVAILSVTAYAEEFRCLEGAKAPAPYKPGNVVRWCEIWKDGELLYHGSVWRWYRSGQMEGKEFYVYGNAEGEWPSWYENGNPSSLGSFKNGSKTGPWKYWDESGWLKHEVIYSETENLWTEYYPTGTKKATGKWVSSGKVGLWTYWDKDGKERARCDFGDGIFALTSESCQVIANELEPEGFSPPVPVGSKKSDGSALIRLASQTYQFTAPLDWVVDAEAGKREQLPLVLYPRGKAWRDPGANIYIRVLYKGDSSFGKIVQNEKETFQDEVGEYTEKAVKREKLKNGQTSVTKTISYKPFIETDSPFAFMAGNTIHEAVSYLDASDKIVLLIVLSCDSESTLKETTSALMSLVTSFRVTDKDGN